MWHLEKAPKSSLPFQPQPSCFQTSLSSLFPHWTAKFSSKIELRHVPSCLGTRAALPGVLPRFYIVGVSIRIECMSPFMSLQPNLNPHGLRVFSPLAGLSRQSQQSNQHLLSAHLCASVCPFPGSSLSDARNKLIIKIIILTLQKGQQTQPDAPFFLSANQIDPAMPASGLIIPWHIVLTIIRQVITEGITVWWFPLVLCMEEDSQIGLLSPHSCHGQQRDRHSCEESSSTYQWNAFKGSCQDMGENDDRYRWYR